jgi:tripartite-type tricarboxylate transporter receptor subunit TctC
MLKVKAGIDILHVPYRGNADALNDILANNVQMMNEINPMPHVKAGEADPARYQLSGAASRLPRRADAVRGWAMARPTCRAGIRSGRRPATPREIIDKLNAKMVEIANTPEMKARLLAINVAFTPQTPDEMGRHLVDDTKAGCRADSGLTNLKLE